MMMKMLEAAGIPPLTDQIREADEDNPKGYFEFEEVKSLDKGGDKAWISGSKGKAVKVISQLLDHLPSDYRYRVVFMERDLREIIASQNRMLVNRGEKLGGQEDEQMIELFEMHLRRARLWLQKQKNFELLYVNYREVLESPIQKSTEVARFLGLKKDQARQMAEVVDPSLYRNRA